MKQFVLGLPLAAGLWLLSLVVFRIPLSQLVTLGLADDRYTYVLLVPPISAFLLWLKSEEIIKSARSSPVAGLSILVAGFLVAALPFDDLGVAVLGMLLVWVGIAVLSFGMEAVRLASFPLLFLLLCIPPPASAMEQVVTFLQKASTDVTAVLYRLVGIAFERDGFVFALDAVEIEVAKECSGIRSATAMFVGSILAGHIFLRNGWSRIGFALLSIPVLIFKNAVRITGITWLGLNVDQGFFTGTLHNYGGMPFALVAVGLLVPALLAVRRMEHPNRVIA